MQSARQPLQDRHGRTIEYMRLSLTEACNFGCLFCMPPGTAVPHDDSRRLSTDEILRLCGVFSSLGVNKYKITGGEPFMHPDAIHIMDSLKRVHGAASVTVTTNGTTLDTHAGELAGAGIDGINISLNGMTQETFEKVTGSTFRLNRILHNVKRASRMGIRVKLNMVPMWNINDREMIPFIEFALEHGVYPRFIELMPIGQGRLFHGLSGAEVRKVIEDRFGPVEIASGSYGNGPALYFSIEGYDIKVGYIAAVSQNFCESCNRVRLTSDGFLKTCLHHNHGADLAECLRGGASDAELAERIRRIVVDKPQHHLFELSQQEKELGNVPMYQIGG